MSPLENTKVTPRNDIVYLEEIIARKNERIALLKRVAEAAANSWSIKVNYTCPIHIALRAAGYLGDRNG